jgi:hypothetical protein
MLGTVRFDWSEYDQVTILASGCGVFRSKIDISISQKEMKK